MTPRTNEQYLEERLQGAPPKERPPAGGGMGQGDDAVPWTDGKGNEIPEPGTAPKYPDPPPFTVLEGLTPEQRKCFPVRTGSVDYFPNALALVALNSLIGNVQHSGPDAPLVWIRGKSPDHADCALRHALEGGNALVSSTWRALALLEEAWHAGEIDVRAMLEELEAAKEQARNGGA